jgi:transcriptional regulator with XRE-family HTH domain
MLDVLSKKILLYRTAMGLTQIELADKAKIHVNLLGKIERSQCNPSFKILISISRALEISPKDLMPE